MAAASHRVAAVSARAGVTGLAIAALVLLYLAPAASSTSTVVQLRVVRCPVEAVVGGDFPRWRSREPAYVPASLAGLMRVYVGGYERVVSVRNSYCKAYVAGNGNNGIEIIDQRDGDPVTVNAFAIPSCWGCKLDVVCAYFPRAERELDPNHGHTCLQRDKGERVTRLSPTLVRVQNRSTVNLLFFPKVTSTRGVQGVQCHPIDSPVCPAALTDWRRSHRIR